MFEFLNLDASADDSLQRKARRVLTSYFMALQPWSFCVSLAPVALGNVLSWREKSQFSLPILMLSTMVVLSVHAAANAVYAYRDGRRGKPGQQRPNAMVQIGALLYVLSCAAMLGVMCISPAKIEHLALLFFGGLSASFLYTGSKTFCFIIYHDIMHRIISVLFNFNLMRNAFK
jgi:1,4-dihydroxy-2-naphthoate octaprenyltransferase